METLFIVNSISDKDFCTQQNVVQHYMFFFLLHVVVSW